MWNENIFVHEINCCIWKVLTTYCSPQNVNPLINSDASSVRVKSSINMEIELRGKVIEQRIATICYRSVLVDDVGSQNTRINKSQWSITFKSSDFRGEARCINHRFWDYKKWERNQWQWKRIVIKSFIIGFHKGQWILCTSIDSAILQGFSGFSGLKVSVPVSRYFVWRIMIISRDNRGAD